MTISIEKVENGYVLKYQVDDLFLTRVVECQAEIEDSEVETFRSLLWEINEILGPSTSRYSPKRISIGTEPGDKYHDSSKEEIPDECI